MSALAQSIAFPPLDAVKLLIVSADAGLQQEVGSRLSTSHWRREFAGSGAHALERLLEEEFDLLLVDPALPDLAIEEFQGLVRAHSPQTQIVCLNPLTGMPAETDGAALAGHVAAALLEEKSGALASSAIFARDGRGLPGVIGEAECMRALYRVCHLLAPRDTTVLLEGESGTGKEVIARAIHQLSARSARQLVVINCAAIPEALLEAELFGFQKGAFTGAVQSRIGRLHAAHGGTLFLDEIGELPFALQAKLLRFLEEGELQRLGSSETYRVDTRVIAATNARLKKMVQEGRFREDLYYRLAVFPIELPPLKERKTDIQTLAMNFLDRCCKQRVSLMPDAVEKLQAHGWPGNVRELKNVMERAAILAGAERQVAGAHILI